jgi:glucose-6-phosphate isomerase
LGPFFWAKGLQWAARQNEIFILMFELIHDLAARFDPESGKLEGGIETVRKLSQLRGSFSDEAAYAAAVAAGDPIVYRVSALAPGSGSGDLHYGLGVLYPGKVGDEYYLTKGHFHEAREAAEVYIGLRGTGGMLLEDEHTGASRWEALGEGCAVYVPGHTAHRTINTGSVPLVYFGIYPAHAGHDYGALATRNFRKRVVERNGVPNVEDR